MVTPPFLKLAFPRAREHHVESFAETIAKVPDEVRSD
jgi:hypothetical protein